MSESSKSRHFYQTLKPISNFNEVLTSKHYTNVPEDWVVIITDIRGSTNMVKEGRYREVNLLGASSIAAAVNALKPLDFPFVFGGDGATLLVPSSEIEICKDALLGAQVLAREQFGVEMRVGMVPVGRLLQEGHPVSVAKYQLNAKNSLAMLNGSGLEVAEKWIKNNGPSGERFNLRTTEKSVAPDLTGLSCRWEPLKAKRGVTLTLMAQNRGDDIHMYEELHKRFEEILHGPLEQRSPVNLGNLVYKLFPKGLNLESKFGDVKRAMARLRVVMLVIHMFRIFPFLGFDFKRYQQAIVHQADYKKFDNVLRMVIDCTTEEANAITEALQSFYDAGRIFYGTHRSSEAIMTCFVPGLNEGHHVHFIDGADGGYTMAAAQMKSQIVLRAGQARA